MIFRVVPGFDVTVSRLEDLNGKTIVLLLVFLQLVSVLNSITFTVLQWYWLWLAYTQIYKRITQVINDTSYVGQCGVTYVLCKRYMSSLEGDPHSCYGDYCLMGIYVARSLSFSRGAKIWIFKNLKSPSILNTNN